VKKKIRVYYALDNCTIHDQRFIRLFSEHSFEVLVLDDNFKIESLINSANRKPTKSSIVRFFQAISKNFYKEILVVSRLEVAFNELKSINMPKIAISFATDLMSDYIHSESLAKQINEAIPYYDLFLVDTWNARNALVALGVNPSEILMFPWITKIDFPKNSHSENKLKIIYPRSIDTKYHPEILISAIEKIKESMGEFELTFISGNDPTRTSELSNLLRLKGLSDFVAWVEMPDENEFLELLSRHDICVSTSPTDGASVSLLQALSLGLQVISSSTAGANDFIINGITGWTFPVGDIDGLVDCLLRAKKPSIYSNSFAFNSKRLLDVEANWEINSLKLINALKHHL